VTEELLKLVGLVCGGGVLGLLGTVITQRTIYKKQTMEHDLNERKHANDVEMNQFQVVTQQMQQLNDRVQGQLEYESKRHANILKEHQKVYNQRLQECEDRCQRCEADHEVTRLRFDKMQLESRAKAEEMESIHASQSDRIQILESRIADMVVPK